MSKLNLEDGEIYYEKTAEIMSREEKLIKSIQNQCKPDTLVASIKSNIMKGDSFKTINHFKLPSGLHVYIDVMQKDGEIGKNDNIYGHYFFISAIPFEGLDNLKSGTNIAIGQNEYRPELIPYIETRPIISRDGKGIKTGNYLINYCVVLYKDDGHRINSFIERVIHNEATYNKDSLKGDGKHRIIEIRMSQLDDTEIPASIEESSTFINILDESIRDSETIEPNKKKYILDEILRLSTLLDIERERAGIHIPEKTPGDPEITQEDPEVAKRRQILKRLYKKFPEIGLREDQVDALLAEVRDIDAQLSVKQQDKGQTDKSVKGE